MLYQGDCLEVMDKLILEGIKVDAIITDIPYGITACKWDTIIPFDEMWVRLNKLIKNNKAIALNSTQPFTSKLINSNLENFKHIWYWNKCNAGSFAVAKYRPLNIIEEICIFTNKGKVEYYPIMEIAKESNKRPRGATYEKNKGNSQGMASGVFKASKTHNENLRYPKNLITYNNRSGELNSLNRLHPTQKPVELMEYLVKTYTNEGDTVLDFTMGSGSTGVACANTNRNFIGIELDEGYFNIAKERIR